MVDRLAYAAMFTLLLVSCGGDPAAADIQTYAAAMSSPLEKNQALAQHFLDIASGVKKGETTGEKIADVMVKELVPEADALVAEVSAIQPSTPKLKDAHSGLVKAWTDRSGAYHAMADAWTVGDLAAFDAAQKRNLQSKLDEERYFTEANAIAGEYGLVITQYP